MATKVEITTPNYNPRATALRADISKVIAIKKCGTDDEFRKAMKALDASFAKFKSAII